MNRYRLYPRSWDNLNIRDVSPETPWTKGACYTFEGQCFEEPSYRQCTERHQHVYKFLPHQPCAPVGACYVSGQCFPNTPLLNCIYSNGFLDWQPGANNCAPMPTQGAYWPQW